MNYPESIKTLVFIAGLGLLVTCGCGFDKVFKNTHLDQPPSTAWSKRSPEIPTAHLAGWTTSADDAMETASREGKHVMALFTGSDWCSWCIKLEDEVFSTSEFQSWASENVIPLKLDFPKRKKLAPHLESQNEALLARYKSHVRGYPTVLFLDANGEVVGKMGYTKGASNWISNAEQKMLR